MSAKRKQQARYRRVLLKLSGEALQGDGESICPRIVKALALEVKDAASAGVEMALVVGGGNIWRGNVAAECGMERATADYMGMLATVINSLALQDALEKVGVQTRVLSSIDMRNVAEPFIRRRALRHLEKGRVVIFAAGTGNPYFTTDTTAALRAAEIGASVLLKATKVDGVYDKDPKLHADAVKFERVEYVDALHRRLRVMDSAAFSLCMENRIPIMVFDMFKKGNIRRAVNGQKVGTLVCD